MYRPQLTGLIRERGYAAVIEITNGLNSERFAGKCSEAKWGKSYLRRCLQAAQKESPDNEEPKVHLDSGVIFFKNESAISKSKYSLDFLYQLKDLKRDRSLQALELIMREEDCIHPDVISQARQMSRLVNNQGIPLERIFYPGTQDIEMLRSLWADLPDNTNDYQDVIRQTKGRVLENYVELLCSQVMRASAPTVIKRHEYEHKGHTIDMDLIIIGDRDEIRKALGNSHDLKRFETKRKEKEPPMRYSPQLAMPRR